MGWLRGFRYGRTVGLTSKRYTMNSGITPATPPDMNCLEKSAVELAQLKLDVIVAEATEEKWVRVRSLRPIIGDVNCGSPVSPQYPVQNARD